MWRIVPGVVYHWNSISLLERDHSLILLQVLCVPVSKNAIRSSGKSSDLWPWSRPEPSNDDERLTSRRTRYANLDSTSATRKSSWKIANQAFVLSSRIGLPQFLKDIVPTERSRSRRFRSFQQSCRNSLIHSKDFFTRWPKDRYLLLTPSKDRVLFSLHLMSLFICFYTID